MDPQMRPSARDVFDVISKLKCAQDQLVTEDPWQVEDGSTFPLSVPPRHHLPAVSIEEQNNAD